MKGFEPFALAVRTHLATSWATLCAAEGLPVPQILLEDPGDNRPSEHYVIFSLLKGSPAPYNGATDIASRLYRTQGRAQILLHLKAGSGPKPADRYAAIWRAVWSAFMEPGTRIPGVRFYFSSEANDAGSIGTHAVWALDVPFRYDELP